VERGGRRGRGRGEGGARGTQWFQEGLKRGRGGRGGGEEVAFVARELPSGFADQSASKARRRFQDRRL